MATKRVFVMVVLVLCFAGISNAAVLGTIDYNGAGTEFAVLYQSN